ncbi:hypothetical protein HDU97_005771 [Phlyctochytrium planicorne]|nr:hypothetical protein HDU97_005771 [Phlyctochytrium planicorne]
MKLTAVFGAILSVSSVLAINFEKRDINSIDWQPCPGQPPSNHLLCATIQVPLNYLDTNDNRTVPIAVSRIPATKPSKGAIFVNPGGPGGAGVNFAVRVATTLPLDDSFDIIGFDPRGIGSSLPIICFPNGAVQTAVASFDLGNPGKRGGITYETLDAITEVKARGCVKYGAFDGQWAKYLSTSITAKDLEFLRVALGQDKFNFVGYSYGTYLGLTYANLFPDKVGRMVIDGVVDPTFFSTDIYEDGRAAFKDSDAVLFAFFKECELAGADLCPLQRLSAKYNLTAKADPGKNLRDAIRLAVDKLYGAPKVAMDVDWPGLVKGTDVDGVLRSILYSPRRWPQAAELLTSLLVDEDPNPFRDYIAGPPDTGFFCPSETYDEGYHAIRCTDAEDLSAVGVDEAVKRAGRPGHQIATIFDVLTCRHWVRPVERYQGPWNTKQNNKVIIKLSVASSPNIVFSEFQILIVSSVLDPITPLVGAKKVHALLSASNSSYLLIHHGYGHTSLGQPSKCSVNTVANFFFNGTLLNEGKGATAECTADLPPFPPKSEGFARIDGGLDAAAEAGLVVAKYASKKHQFA